MREICTSGSTSGEWKRSTVGEVKARNPKGPEQRMRPPKPPRHSSTLLGAMIIWVGERFKPLLARRAPVLEKEMITWVCGTVGLWDSGNLRISRKMNGRKIIQVGQENLDGINRMDRMNWDKNEMIIWVCGTVGLWDCGTVGLLRVFE